MPYLAGLLTGVFLTVLVVFLIDNLAVVNAPTGTEPQKIRELGCSGSEAAFLHHHYERRSA